MHVTICIVAPSDNLRHSLSVLLTALGTSGTIYEYDQIASTLRQQENAPSLIVLDATALADDVAAGVKRLKVRWPDARIVALSANEGQGQQLCAAGSDVIITEGILAARLRTMLNDLLLDGGESM